MRRSARIAAAGCTAAVAASLAYGSPARADDQLWTLTAGAGEIRSQEGEVLIWSDGRAATKLAGGAGISFRAKGGQCDGAPELRIEVDGQYAGHFSITNPDEPQNYQLDARFPYGEHDVAFTFVNNFDDPSREGCDRSVTLSKVGDAADYSNPFNVAPAYGNEDYKSRVSKALEGASLTDRLKALPLLTSPVSTWLGQWTPAGQVAPYVSGVIAKAKARNETPVFVLYGMGGCLGKSTKSIPAAGYQEWIGEIAATIGSERAAIILEPDALPFSGTTRCNANLPALRKATDRLSQLPSAAVYIDAGHPAWLPAADAISKLREAGVAGARGFSLNVANTQPDDALAAYGNTIAKALGKHYVTDTSRNGASTHVDTCNPGGTALGKAPRSFPYGYQDARLWVKSPGESDGSCKGAPAEGEFWLEYALDFLGNSWPWSIFRKS